jgi:signal transduction histidine kinase
MKVRFIFFVLLLQVVLGINPAHTQPSADSDISSLLKALQASKRDTNRGKAYVQLVEHYKVLKPDSASYFISQGLAFVNSIDDKKGKGKLLQLNGSLDLGKSMFNKAKQDYTDALTIDRSINNTSSIATDYSGLAQAYVYKGDYTNATNCYMEALKIFEKINNKRGLGGVYQSLGMLNEEVGDKDKALGYLLKAQDILSTIPFSVVHLQLMNNLGMFYNDIGKHDTAIKILRMGIERSTAPGYAFVRAQLLSNAGNVLYAIGNTEGALKYMQESLSLAQKMGLKVSECYALVNVADLLKGDPKSTLADLKEALAISQEVGEKHLQANIYGELADFFKNQGQFAEALDATQKKYALQDSILNKQKNIAIADLQSTYELQKSNDKVDNLMLINSRDEFKAKLVVAIAVGISLILIVGGYNYRKIAILNKQLKVLNQVTIAQREELKELHIVKDKIFSVIGHDLRSPLGSTIGMMQIIEEDNKIDEESKAIISELKAQAQASLDTLDKLLHWGKSSFKGTTVQQEIFVADTIVKSNIDLLSSVAHQKHIAVTNSIPGGVQVYADVSHFDFVTRNLLSNALKFTPAGGSINISVEGLAKPGFIVFAVRDNGVGIGPEEQDHLFSLDNTTKIGTQEEVGTGIGLLLCKEFVAKNGGELWVSSKLDEGSTFYFSFKSAEA